MFFITLIFLSNILSILYFISDFAHYSTSLRLRCDIFLSVCLGSVFFADSCILNSMPSRSLNMILGSFLLKYLH